MEISPRSLDKFRAWLAARGRNEDTIELYVGNLKKCAADPKGLTHRLVGKALSPNSRRTNKAALAAWARFSKDSELRDLLDEIRLPPARRVTAKVPHDLAEWKTFVGHLRTCPLRRRDLSVDDEAMRQVLLIVAIRGLRVGDVMRIRRADVHKALDSGVLSYVGKGAKRHEISAAPIRDQLEALSKVGKWDRMSDLISTGKSRRCAHRKVGRQLAAVAKKAGIKGVYPHRFRHTFATQFLEQLKGDPNALVKLQQFMGWESVQTAARYVSHVSQEQLDTIGAGIIGGLLG